MIRKILAAGMLLVLLSGCAVTGGPILQKVDVTTSLGSEPVRVTLQHLVEVERYTHWTPTFWLLEPAAAYTFKFEHSEYETVVLSFEAGGLPASIHAEMKPKE